MTEPQSDVPLIRTQKMTVEFGPQTVLRDVSIEVARGETLAVIGESGCGKTVLLKTLIGLVRPTTGWVEYGGIRIDSLDERGLVNLRTRIGFVFQSAALFDSMTVADNIAFPLRQHRHMEREEAYAVARDRLREVGLRPEVLMKKPAELSGGMRKRVGLARALAMDPETLLYDEPTTGLDPIMSDVINELILGARSLHKVTGVVVTHDMHSALKLADRIVMLYPIARLEPGEPQILFSGSPAEIQRCKDRRVSQFVRGEAGDRIHEIASTVSA